jgi:uncharacterized membrane protein YhaH (DUF805 family)
MIQTFVNSNLIFASWKPVINSSLFAIGTLFVLACVIIAIAAAWKLFEKAGRPGWEAIVPVYSTWVLFEISGKPGWWALVGLIPYVGWVILFVLYILAMLELAKRFGQTVTFAIFGLIVFQVIGFLILAFGDAKYNDHYDDERSFQNPTLN